MQFNTCLNKKLSIDENGLIKNCPSCSKYMGFANEAAALIKASDSSQYAYYSRLKKDDIDVCKDCEFRHVCTDCRQYLTDSGNVLSKPAKCTYNPYTARW